MAAKKKTTGSEYLSGDKKVQTRYLRTAGRKNPHIKNLERRKSMDEGYGGTRAGMPKANLGKTRKKV